MAASSWRSSTSRARGLFSCRWARWWLAKACWARKCGASNRAQVPLPRGGRRNPDEPTDRHVQEVIKRNVKDVAHALQQFCEKHTPRYVVLGGNAEIVNEVRAHLDSPGSSALSVRLQAISTTRIW